jgi:Uma2 family endonuclease
MFAMAGARFAHNRVVANAIAQFTFGLRSRPCQVTSNDMRVRVSATDLYTYPDVVIVCGEPQFLDDRQDTLLNPTLIVEVLSPSTEAYDRGRKFEHYRSIESLREYVLVSSDRMQVDQFTRQTGGQWLLTSASAPEETIALESIDCKFALADLYEKVDLTASAAAESGR